MDSRICDNCGNSFQSSRNDPEDRFCSRKCRSSFYGNKKRSMNGRNWRTPVNGVPPKKCLICSRTFYKKNRKYCSDICSYTSNVRQQTRLKRRISGVQGFMARRCPRCKLLFVTNNINRKYCSDLHREEHHSQGRMRLKKQMVCKYIYDTKDDPDSISDLIEDLTGVRCPIKDKEDH